MNINVTKSAGVVLKTQGKYCAEDITVVPVLEENSVTPTESAQEIVPSDGNCGISKVNVGAVQTETKTITPTTSQQTFTPTSGKYFKQVICQAIQTETKTVAPSASAQTYSPSSGKYFANFTVSAVPSQSKTVTPTKSVQTVNADSGKWLSSVTVNPIPDEFIQPSGSQDITANGTYDVTEKASVNVNVPTASAVEEVATASAMNALLVEANVGKYYKFIGTTDTNYTNGDLYLVEGAEQDQLAGTWVFNNAIPPTFSGKEAYYTEGDIHGLTPTSDYGYFINFIWKDSSGEYNCNYIYNFNYDAGTTIGVATYPNGAAHVFNGTMIITSKLSEVTNGDALLTWLQANATKQ